jgi:hypothetical protein
MARFARIELDIAYSPFCVDFAPEPPLSSLQTASLFKEEFPSHFVLLFPGLT